MASVISLKKLKISDITYFFHWWCNKDLLRLTSGRLKRISDQEVKKSFEKIIRSKKDTHHLITLNNKVIGHIALISKHNGWFEIQIIIGNKRYWNKGYGTRAIKQLLRRAKQNGINKIYLEVRPTNLRAIRAYKKCGFQEAGIKKYPKNKYLSETLKMVLNN